MATTIKTKGTPIDKTVETQGAGNVFHAKGQTLKDGRDGKTYKTVEIGNQTWMAENLNYKTDSGSWCYENNDSNCKKYGRLYDWNTAKTACPPSWHLPSRQEWVDLIGNVGGFYAAGKKLRAKSRIGNGTDEYGFSAVPSGCRYPDGYFKNIGAIGFFWTITARGGIDHAYYLTVYDNGDIGEQFYFNKEYGFSVRCLRNN